MGRFAILFHLGILSEDDDPDLVDYPC